jgi:signal transduction histidine kinase
VTATPRRRWNPWPRGLAWRTALTLLLGLAIVQGLGLTIHALDRIDLERLGEARDFASRVMGLYRNVVIVPPGDRPAQIAQLQLPPGLRVELADHPLGNDPGSDLHPIPWPIQRVLRINLMLVPLPPPLRPREFRIMGNRQAHDLLVALRLPDGAWLNVMASHLPPPRPWLAPDFLIAFVAMTLAAALLTLWAVRRLTAPVALLAAAAERLGRDVNAPPLPEDGPTEVAVAAAAFNTMAGRIRRFVQDRTFLLTAIGHDLRTPITRLKLRAEFMEDDDQRAKMLADLDELEAMVAATLAFGRDISATEAVAPLDLPALARTVLDEATDAEPEVADRLEYEGPDHLTTLARPLAMKRALANLVSNALKYGGNARIVVARPQEGHLTLLVEDDGPGIPPTELDRVFEPFQRIEGSRNRETGGTGLGLPIARNILRAHGGDVILTNRPMGGTCAVVTLPA